MLGAYRQKDDVAVARTNRPRIIANSGYTTAWVVIGQNIYWLR